MHVGCLVKQSRSWKRKEDSSKEFCSTKSDCFMCHFVDKNGKTESEDRETDSIGLGSFKRSGITYREKIGS